MLPFFCLFHNHPPHMPSYRPPAAWLSCGMPSYRPFFCPRTLLFFICQALQLLLPHSCYNTLCSATLLCVPTAILHWYLTHLPSYRLPSLFIATPCYYTPLTTHLIAVYCCAFHTVCLAKPHCLAILLATIIVPTYRLPLLFALLFFICQALQLLLPHSCYNTLCSATLLCVPTAILHWYLTHLPSYRLLVHHASLFLSAEL